MSARRSMAMLTIENPAFDDVQARDGIGVHHRCTLREFVRANLDAPEIDAIATMAIGATVMVGGGAMPLLRIRRTA